MSLSINSDYRALTGAVRLLLSRGQEGIGLFTADQPHFQRSFFALILILPMIIPGALIDGQQSLDAAGIPTNVSWTQLLLLPVTVLIIDWFALPVVAWAAFEASSMNQRYYLFVICRNWSAVVSSCFLAIIELLHLTGAVPEPLLILLVLFALTLTIVYRYWGVAASLQSSTEVHILMVALDIALYLFVLRLVSNIIIAG